MYEQWKENMCTSNLLQDKKESSFQGEAFMVTVDFQVGYQQVRIQIWNGYELLFLNSEKFSTTFQSVVKTRSEQV